MRFVALALLIAFAGDSVFAEARSAWESGDASLGAAASTAAAPGLHAIEYKLSGDRTVLPSSIYDDGARTYIQWGPTQSIPAVFGLDQRGREELVNGYMRDGSFTIDRVYPRLVFRMDDARASARRKSIRKK